MRNLVFAICAIATMLLYSTSYAQRICGSNDLLREQLKNDPEFALKYKNIQAFTVEYVKKGGSRNLVPQLNAGTVLYTIPVVVHVVYNTAAQNVSDAQIQSQIDVLNKDYQLLNTDASSVPTPFKPLAADCKIQFCMAKRDPSGNPTTGIVRKATTRTSFTTNDAVKKAANGDLPWDATKYLNIWVCNLSGGVLGYAQFPGGPVATDGVVITYTGFGTTGTAAAPFNLGRTATHEVGHWLDLYHIWGDDGTACTGSDEVGDTPNQADENYGCPSFPTVSCSNGPNGDMWMNYMDYTDDQCMYMFTVGQRDRMYALFQSGGARASLLNSQGCTPLVATCDAPVPIAGTITQTGATISWPAVFGAATYDLQYKTSAAGSFTTVAGIAGTTYNLTGLTPATVYNYQVKTNCSATESTYSTTANFTTLAATGGCSDNYEDNNTLATAKPIPVNVPTTGIISSNPDKDFFTITNTAATPNIQISLTNLPKNYDLRLYKANGVPLVTSQNIGTADESVTYNTTVVATYIVAVYAPNATSSPNCYTLQVNLSSGTPVTCNVPVPSASAITQTTATISWPAVSGAASYDLQYKTSAAGSFTTVSGIAGTSYNLSGLTAATVYNYQVKTNCSGGTSAYSTTASFTTLAAACNAPVPAASAIAQATATISWPAVSGAASYDLQYKTSAEGSFTTVAGIAGTSYNLTSLTSATVYNYQVKTNCSGGASAYSTTANFTTLSATGGCTDIYEDNNTSATAKPIPLGTPVTGLITSQTDLDYFTVTNTAAQPNIRIALTNVPKNYDVVLYKPSGVPAGTGANTGTANELITYNATVVGVYKVVVYGYNKVFNATSCYTLQADISASPFRTSEKATNLIAAKDGVTIYPQPAKGIANLQFAGGWKGMTNVAINNQLGVRVGNVNLNVEGGYGKLDITNLKPGMYYLRLSNGGKSVTQKLMVQK